MGVSSGGRGGTILQTASLAGLLTSGWSSHTEYTYTATKHAAEGRAAAGGGGAAGRGLPSGHKSVLAPGPNRARSLARWVTCQDRACRLLWHLPHGEF